jgi:leucyl aminopeptidase (aminopeptidase T)
MKYKKQLFDYAVKDYLRILEEYKYRSIFVVFDIENQEALLSIAPLSQALHELHADMTVISRHKGKCVELDVLRDIWTASEELTAKVKSKKSKILGEFIKVVNPKTGNRFEKLFKPPALFLESLKSGFSAGKNMLPYKYKWFKQYKAAKLNQSAQKIWKYAYALKPKELVWMDLPLIPPENILKLPLEDYLDSYAVAWTLARTALNLGADMKIWTDTQRVSPFEPAVHISDLILTLYGCEYCKTIKESIFQHFADVSKAFNLSRLVPPDARLTISPQGFPGRHLFGEVIGYPTSTRKSRWDSVYKMFCKMEDDEQSEFEARDPVTRLALTETLPIDVFVDTTNIDYNKLRKKTRGLKEMLQGCIMVNVISHEVKEHATNLIVDIGPRKLDPDDSDVTNIIDPGALKRTKKKYGMYTNIPGGEVFFTPHSMHGTFVGDVVMHVDRSVMLSPKHPIVVHVEEGRYKIISAPSDLLRDIEHVKQEHLKVLLEKERHGSLPKSMIEMQKSNFDRIGEFAINTHPTAKVCDYLVVNEKIARMLHIALGKGFEKDRKTVYHFDIVIDAAKQKLDVYGIKPDGTEVWVLRKGRMVI